MLFKNIPRRRYYSPVTPEAHLSNIYKFSRYLTENALLLYYKEQSVNAIWGIKHCLFWEPYEYVNALCGQNTECLIVKEGGTYSYHYALYG
jgi:hypothetical protein